MRDLPSTSSISSTTGRERESCGWCGRAIQSPEGQYKHRILITLNSDGSGIQVAVSPGLWKRRDHHPNWHPGGERILTNLAPKDQFRFCLFRHDGSDFRTLSEDFLGSGHPGFEKTGRHILTDSYPNEPVALANGEVPLRLIGTRPSQDRMVATMFTLGRKEPTAVRLDPHPAWSRDGRRACFNGAPAAADRYSSPI